MTAKQPLEQPTHDPAELAKLYADIAQKSSRLVTQYLERASNGGARGMTDELGITQAYLEAWKKLLADPFKLAEAQVKLWQDYIALWQSSKDRKSVV